MSFPLSSLPDKTFEAYLAIPTKASYGIHPDWFPRHDAHYDTPLSHNLNELYHTSTLPSSLYFDSALSSPDSTSSTLVSSPGRSESESDSSDTGSSSGSDSHSEPEVDRNGSWTVSDNYAYHQAPPSPEVADDVPYIPPPTVHTPPIATQSTFAVDQYTYMSQITDELALSYPSSRASRQKANANLSVIFDGDSEVDAEGESDDGGSEDEYIPSPRLQPRDRRTYQYAYNSSRSQSPATSAASSSSNRRPRYPTFGSSAASPHDTLFKRTKPRHEQYSAPIPVNYIPGSSNRWKCPHPHCHYVQKNRRMPDFKRHLQTHTRFLEPERWICCGIPIGDAPFDVIANSESPIEFDGELMVGGCWKVFSRRDALKRHLDNKNIPCRGNLNGSWMPGNHATNSSMCDAKMYHDT